MTSFYEMTPARAREAVERFEALARANDREVVVHPDGRVCLLGSGERPVDTLLALAAHLLAAPLRDSHQPWRCGWCGHAAELPDGICAACHGLLRALEPPRD